MDTPLATQHHADPPPGQCWCCGSIANPDRMVHLGDHPEVAMCLPCARWAVNQAWEIEDRDRSGILVSARDRSRRLRRGVIDRGWHRHPVFGRSLRWLGKHLP